MKDLKNRKKHNCKVFYLDLFGRREHKYDWLWNNTVKTAEWKELKPAKDAFYFVEKDFKYLKTYKKFLNVTKVFNLYNIGTASGHDIEFVKFNESEFSFNDKEFICDYFYRPFDIRKILYDKKKLQRARYSIMQYVKNHNIILILPRFAKNQYPQALVSNKYICRHSVTDKTYVFPLFTYDNNNEATDNFTKEFREFIRAKYKENFSPEQILGYIYAILHSPTYRTKYEEMLKIDFPSVPFTDDEQLFLKLSEIGSELIEHHLLNKEYENKICRICGVSENYKVEKCEYDKGKVWFNKDRYFEPVPENIWNFYIGGYQVLDKWLKERKKHSISLTSDDIRHFIKVVNVLDVTIRTAEEIDQITKDWI